MSRDTITVRRARPEDHPQVRAISAQIWEGRDYIPRVWERWLADPEGAFVVAERAGRVVGVAKLTRLGEREWWMEGLRVDPAQRRQGVSKALSLDLLARLRAAGGGRARFGTGSHNVPVHRSAERDGFVRQAAFAVYAADALPPGPNPSSLCALVPDEAGKVWHYLETSADFEANRRSYAQGWKWYFSTGPRLLEMLQAGRVYGWFGDGGNKNIGGVVMLCEPDADREGRSRLRVAYMDVNESHLAAAARAVRRLAGQMGISTVNFKPLSDSKHIVALEQAGYECAWEHEIWLYALDLGRR